MQANGRVMDNLADRPPVACLATRKLIFIGQHDGDDALCH
jgi:hypothetical protein